MDEVRRGGVYWVAPDEARGSVPPIAHPYVVVQDDVFNRSRVRTVVVMGLTSNLSRANEPGNVLTPREHQQLGQLRLPLILWLSSR